MRGPKKKNQRKWENSEEYLNAKKEKEYLNKYKTKAGEYLEDWEFIEIFKKYNYDDEQIKKELNKIILGDEFKWKEIKNGKPVTTRSTDQIRKKKNYYHPEKSYPSYDRTEEEANEPNNNNNRNFKGSYHKYYPIKKPKRPFQKCYEVPSDYKFPTNSQNKNNNNDNNNTNNNINDNNNNKNNINENENEKENLKPKNNENFDENNKKNIKKTYIIKKNEEKKNEEKSTSDEEKKNLLLKGRVFDNLKRIKTNTDIKKKESIEIYRGKENNEDNINKAPGPEININQDIILDKDMRKKYFNRLVGNMKHYSKKMENNIKRASSKDSETSDDRSPETIKRKKRNNIPTSSNIIQKKKIIINNNTGINRNLKTTYEIQQSDIEFESKVANISINSCYDNPYRDQYLKLINEKRKQNPGKIVEFVIPQFNTSFLQPYPSLYQYNPYLNQNMYMYQQQYGINNQQINSQMNLPLNPQINQQMNMQLNPQINYQTNPQMNMQLNQQFNNQMRIPMNQKINSPVNSPLNSQINLQLSPPQINHNNYTGINDPRILSPQSNNAPSPELVNSNNNMNNK